jgi:hypothetical protein
VRGLEDRTTRNFPDDEGLSLTFADVQSVDEFWLWATGARAASPCAPAHSRAPRLSLAHPTATQDRW